MDYYIKITEPYANNLKDFLKNKYIAIPSLAFLSLMGLMFILFPLKMNKLIIYNHTSLLLAIIFWYILSHRDYCKSSYFFIGTLCTHMTYFINLKQYWSDNVYTLFFLIILYFPILDVAYEMHGLLFMVCIIFSMMILYVKRRIFVALSTIFIGSYIIVCSLIYLATQQLLGKFGILGIFVVCSAGILFNKHVKKNVFEKKPNIVCDMSQIK